MTDTMQGKRVEWRSQIMEPGEYAKLPEGIWYAETPNGHCANLSAHEVTEHEDGTITVAPSILVMGVDPSHPGNQSPKNPNDHPAIVGPTQWHGFLERGVWREC